MTRHIVITGANGGIGYETARALAAEGDSVILAVRNTTKGAAAADQIVAEFPAAEVDVMSLDLSDLASVRQFAGAHARLHPSPDVLVNNAGVMALPRRLSADGYELQFATNHLGHFALAALMVPRMLERPAPRVVTVASLMHRLGRIRFDDLNADRRYSKWLVYSNTKLANLMFMLELQRRADAAGLSLRSLAAHPGYSSTGLQFAGPQLSGSGLKAAGYALLNRLVGQSPVDGARPTVHAATADLPGGSYVGPDGLFEVHGAPKLVQTTRRAHDALAAHRLWAVSEQLTGVRFILDSTTASTGDPA